METMSYLAPTSIRRGIVDLGWSSTALFVSKGMAFLSMVLVARAISASDFGVFVVAVTAAALSVPLLDSGFSALVFRVSSRESTSRLALLSDAARARLPLWILALAVSALLAAVSGTAMGLLPLLVALASISQTHLDTATAEYQGRQRYRAGAALRVTVSVLSLIGAVLVMAYGSSAADAMFVYTMARVLPCLALMGVARANAHAREDLTWSAALPLGVLSVIVVLYVRSDIVLLPLFGTRSAEVAVYGVTYSILTALQILPGAIANTLFPRLARRLDIAGRIHHLTLVVTLTCLSVVLAGLLIFASKLFGFFGPHYEETYRTTIPLLGAIVPISASMLSINALQATDGERKALPLVLGALITNVSLNLLLIPRFGVSGAIIATLTTEVSLAVGSTWVSSKHSRVSTLLVLVGSGAAILATMTSRIGAVAYLTASTAIFLAMLAPVRSKLRKAKEKQSG